MRRIITTVTLALLAVTGAACTPEQVALFHALSPEDQGKVIEALATPRPVTDCYSAIDRYWPGDKARMRQIVWRESRNNPSAQNSRSSAAGCAQLLALHAHRFDAVGCSWARRYEAACNIKAAADLYRQAGWSPWNL